MNEGKIDGDNERKEKISSGQEIDIKTFCEEYEVDGVIRIHQKDFEYIDLNKESLTHFNLGRATQEKGMKYAIIKIQKAGGMKNCREIQPLFDLSVIVLAECSSFAYKNIDEIDDSVFEDSLGNIQNKDDLKREMIFRYRKFRPGKNDEEILFEGVSITKLEIQEIKEERKQ